jgi:hypothetical protein
MQSRIKIPGNCTLAFLCPTPSGHRGANIAPKLPARLRVRLPWKARPTNTSAGAAEAEEHARTCLGLTAQQVWLDAAQVWREMAETEAQPRVQGTATGAGLACRPTRGFQLRRGDARSGPSREAMSRIGAPPACLGDERSKVSIRMRTAGSKLHIELNHAPDSKLSGNACRTDFSAGGLSPFKEEPATAWGACSAHVDPRLRFLACTVGEPSDLHAIVERHALASKREC